jgi:hypothetical protein
MHGRISLLRQNTYSGAAGWWEHPGCHAKCLCIFMHLGVHGGGSRGKKSE